MTWHNGYEKIHRYRYCITEYYGYHRDAPDADLSNIRKLWRTGDQIPYGIRLDLKRDDIRLFIQIKRTREKKHVDIKRSVIKPVEYPVLA